MEIGVHFADVHPYDQAHLDLSSAGAIALCVFVLVGRVLVLEDSTGGAPEARGARTRRIRRMRKGQSKRFMGLSIPAYATVSRESRTYLLSLPGGSEAMDGTRWDRSWSRRLVVYCCNVLLAVTCCVCDGEDPVPDGTRTKVM